MFVSLAAERQIDVGSTIYAVTFSANGETLVGGGKDGVRVWRLDSGQETARLETTGYVWCVAVSKDGKWIAAGTFCGNLFVWDASTHLQTFAHCKEDDRDTNGVDFSPDSTRLVTASDDCTATIWEVTTGQRVLTLDHDDWVVAAKYAPRGDRIATATPYSVRVYDAKDARLLIDIPTRVISLYNGGLVWSSNHLFVVSDSKIEKIDASTGSRVSKWTVPDGNYSPCIAIPTHGIFVAYPANHTVTFWDTSTHSQLGVDRHAQDIRSIALSPDNQWIAIGGGDKIAIKRASHITASISSWDPIPLIQLHPTFQEPDIQIDDDALIAWKHDQLAHAEALLTTAIITSQNPGHHTLASRALVRRCLGNWDAAIQDANQSIEVEPSVIGYVAKSVALVGKGEKYEAYRTFDIAFERFHSSHVTFILLVKAIVVFVSGDYQDAISRLDDLIATVPFNSMLHVVQAHMYLLLGNLRVESNEYEVAIQSFERARLQIRHHPPRSLSAISLIFGWRFDNLDLTIRQRLCEALYATGRIDDACKSAIEMVNSPTEDICVSRALADWFSNFVHQCFSTPQAATVVPQRDDVLTHPMPSSITSRLLLREWAKSKLTILPWKDALIAALGFVVPRFSIYRALCDHLEMVDCIMDAVECFHQMTNEMTGITDGDWVEWVIDFRQRCTNKMLRLGGVAVDGQRHDDAIALYSAALSLSPVHPQNILLERSKVYAAMGLWKDALNDANEIIVLDPSSPFGYKRKHAALYGAEQYADAMDAFETMFSLMVRSSDPDIRERSHQYINPEETKTVIRKAVQNAVRELPRVLINTISGRLYNRSQQAAAFEALPNLAKLVSSMMTCIDHARIQQQVTDYYRYATLSHKWEENEPLFEKVVHVVVYELEDFPTHGKLQMFCKVARDAGFHWAWSDTCCIDRSDHLVLQEALVAMFRWYQGSSLTVVHLRGVFSPSNRGDLMRSTWNTRSWTFQEYHASRVVRFFNEDWTLYMNLDIPNHKESPEIISEMEEATSLSAQALTALRPGLFHVQEKLYLASRREATYVEDEAYSLFGIFAVSLPVVYGEGDQALGRLLAQLLASSGDTSILAWTGKSGSFNSCLPARLAVFNQAATTHIPTAIGAVEMEVMVAGLRASPLASNSDLAVMLYDLLNDLPVPLFSGKRMKFSCITFKLGRVSALRGKSERMFRAQTTALGVVEIRTTEDLSRLDSLVLVHPWIDFLLDRRPIEGVPEMLLEEDRSRSSVGELAMPSGPYQAMAETPQTRASRFVARFGLPFGGQPIHTVPLPRYEPSLRPPSTVLQTEKELRALQMVARLRRPFGALLLTPTRQNAEEYRRVASESVIMVQMEEITPAMLNKLVDSVRMLDVL